MSRYQPYPSYKESGVEWLGEVPAHWQSIKFKHILFEKKKETNIDLNCGSISFGEVVFKDDEKIPEETKASYQEVLAGEFLVNPLNLNYDLKSLRTALSKIDVVVSSGYIVLKSHEDANKNYLRWLLYQFDVAHMKTLGSGVRQTINYADIGNSYFLEPTPDEQTAIADFLDRETAKIDTLIAKQERMIELLGEKRSALISHAVTKGLDPNVKMKDSGVEWLGDVPEHWEVTKIGVLSDKIGSGKTPKGGSEVYLSEGVVFIRSQNVYDEGLRLDDVVFISEKIDEEMKNTRVQPGDILLNITGASIGRTALVPEDFINANVNQHVCIIRINDPKFRPFVSLVMKSNFVKNQIDMLQNGAAREGLNFEQIANILLVLPPVNEQLKISSFLEDKTAKIDTLIAKARQAIELMKERRTALISAAVTGKIDVRGVI